jgi:hypothetical protein
MELLRTIRSNLSKSAEAYRSAEPYPHIVIDNFLPDSVLENVIESFSSARVGHLDGTHQRCISGQARVE